MPDPKGAYVGKAHPKVVLASPEWFELASKLLAEVARECGEDGLEPGVLRELSDEEIRAQGSSCAALTCSWTA